MSEIINSNIRMFYNLKKFFNWKLISGLIIIGLFFNLGIFIFQPVKIAEAALQPVTIQGDRFYSGGKPFFPTTNFLSWAGSYEESSNTVWGATGMDYFYFYTKMSVSQRETFLRDLKNMGYNSIYVILTSEKWGITPYRCPGGGSTCINNFAFGGDFDSDKIDSWKTEFRRMINIGLRPIVFVFPDFGGGKSPTVEGAGQGQWESYMRDVAATFGGFSEFIWIFALEVNENWGSVKTNDLVKYFKDRLKEKGANQPVGIHVHGDNNYLNLEDVDFVMWEYDDWYNNWQEWPSMYDTTKTMKAKNGGKPFFAGEYTLRGRGTANLLGLAAAFAGAAGVGNGAPSNLSGCMEKLYEACGSETLTPTREGDNLSLKCSSAGAVANVNNVDSCKVEGIGPPPGAPYVTSLSPAEEAVAVPVDTNISFQLKDNEEGVDKLSIVMTVNGETVTPVITGEAKNYTVTYDPSVNFKYNQKVTVTIEAKDLAVPSHAMRKETYYFTTISISEVESIIFNLSAPEITDTSITITWQTKEPATSQVKYGKTMDYGTLSPLKSELTSSHSVTLTGLSRNTTYYFKALSKDSAGNEFEFRGYSFSTRAEPIVPVSAPTGLIPCGGCKTYDENTGECLEPEDPCQFCHIFVLLNNVVKYLLLPPPDGGAIVPVVAVLMVVIAGVFYFFSAGNPDRIKRARALFKYLIWGLIIAYGGWLIVNLFFQLIGLSEWTGLVDNPETEAIEGWWQINCPMD